MDIYFVLVIVIFIVAAISLLIFALHGATCNDDNDLLMESKCEPVQLTMPSPPNGMEFSPSLISPYPAQPPSMGFKDFPHSSSPWPPAEIAQNTDSINNSVVPTRTSPYPLGEELPRMPFPRQTVYHTASTSQNYNRTNPSQLPTASATVSRPNVTTYSRDELPPPYSEATDQRQPSARNRRNRFKGKRSSQ